MATIYVNDTMLPLDSGLDYTIDNPFFDIENAVRTYSFPFKIPINILSKNAFKHADRYDAKGLGTREYKSILHLKSLHTEGLLRIDNDNEKFFDCAFTSYTQSIFERLENVQVQDVVGTETIPQLGTPHLYLNINNYNTSTYSIKINDVTYSVNTSQTGFGSRLTEMQNLRTAIAADFPAISMIARASGIDLFNTSGLKFDGYIAGFTATSYMNENDVRVSSFVSYMQNKYEVTNQYTAIVFPAFYAANAYAAQTPAGFVPYVNRVHKQNNVITPYLPNVQTEPKTISEYTYVPFLRVQYVLRQIGNKIGYNIVFDCDNYTNDFNKLLIFNNKTIDVIPREDWYVDTFSDNANAASAPELRYVNHFQTEIPLSNHIQKTTAKAFLQRLCNAFSLYIKIEEDTIYLRRKKAITDKTATRLWLNTINLKRKHVLKKGLTIDYIRNNNDVKSSIFEKKFDGQTFIELPFYTLPNIHYLAYDMPNTEGGLQSVQSSERKDFGWAFLFDNGEAEGSQGGVFYRKCSYESDTFTLKLQGSDNLYDTQLSGVVEYAEASILSFSAVVNAEMLNKVLDIEKSKVFIETQKGAIEGIVSSVSVNELLTNFIINLEIKIL